MTNRHPFTQQYYQLYRICSTCHKLYGKDMIRCKDCFNRKLRTYARTTSGKQFREQFIKRL